MSDTAATTVGLQLSDVEAFRLTGGRNPVGGQTLHIADPPPASDAVRNFRVALVSMPFGCAFRPSIQVGLMKAVARHASFPVDDFYPTLDLSMQLGFQFCEDILNEAASDMTGDWLFSIAAFGDDAPNGDYFAAFPTADRSARAAEGHRTEIAFSRPYMIELRESILPKFIDDWFHKVDWGSYGAVGFSSTFQQNVASLALARRIKECYPHVKIIFGGSTLAGEMGVEYCRAFRYIDYAVNGEGDAVFPELLTRLAEGRNTDDMRGVVRMDGDLVVYAGAAEPYRDLETQPIPDYDTYYEIAARYGLTTRDEFLATQGGHLALRAMPIEGSRGCWWGEKSHCTFCGFNRDTMHFRAKSAERVLAEIDELSRRYNRKVFWACDSIMEMRYVNGLFGPLETRTDGYEFFFFTKSNMTREQVRQVARGGMKVMFPGIESLNSHVLKLMRKGVTKLQNVNLLRWATYYRVQLGYFLLHGFPGEKLEDYEDELATCRMISHLNPPINIFRLRIDRFSPNFWDKELFPVKWQRPVGAYQYIYPLHVNLEEAAYYFEYDTAGDVVPEAAHDESRKYLDEWKTSWFGGARTSLTYRWSESDILVFDTRQSLEHTKTYTLLGQDAEVYEACSSAPRTPAQICAALSSQCPGVEPDEETVAATCEALCEYELMIGEAGKYLSLALPADPDP